MGERASQAITRALCWAVGEGMSIEGRLTPDELEALRDVFGAGAAWRPALDEPLRAFAHAYLRLADGAGLPLLTAGDAAEALNEVRGRGRVAWCFDPTPGPAALEALGFAETSRGIAAVERDNHSGWRQHARQNRALVRQAAAQLPGRAAAVIGAGQDFDLPLRALAERYERLVLIDVDARALRATIDACFADPPLRARVEAVACDVTGLAHSFPADVDAILERHAGAETAYAALGAWLESFHFAAPPSLLGEARPPVDTVHSCMVLSQLATPLTAYVERRLAARFGAAAAAPQLRRALASFARAVQHAHVQALVATAPSFVLSSDLTERATSLGPAGVAADVTREVPLLAVGRLDELLPARHVRPLAAAEWDWPRLLPRPGRRGSTLRVQGVVASVRK